jgi:Ca2+-binding RTX toxin-like protein
MPSSPRRPHRPVLLACVIALAAAPTAARAATITYSDAAHAAGLVVYTANAGETLNTSVGYEATCTVPAGTATDCVSFYGDGAPTLGDSVAQQVCGPDGGGATVCVLDAPNGGVHVVGGSGNDVVNVYDAGTGGFAATTSYAIVVDGGDGNDKLVGGDAKDTLSGQGGSDDITGQGNGDAIDGGDGNDTLGGDTSSQLNETTNGGDDVIHGGPGDDRLTGDGSAQNAAIGHDLLDGGAGTDTAYNDWYRFDGAGNDEDPSPTVSLDGQANDGRPAENDDVLGIERVDTGYQPGAAGTYTGSDGPDTFNLIFADGSVATGPGDDVVTGADGADAIDGGAGNDQLSGGFGADTITGGPGQDDIGGDRTAACFYGPIYGTCTIGSGNDTIYAQDGERDTVDCGPGADTASVDAVDVVANCETVHAPPPAGAGPAPGGPVTATPTPVAVPVARLVIGHQHLEKIGRARAIRLACRLPRAGRCTVRATISRATARRLHLKLRRGAKSFVLGTGHRTLRRAGTGRLTLRLSRRSARALRRTRRLRVTFTVTARYGDRHRTTTARATLKR